MQTAWGLQHAALPLQYTALCQAQWHRLCLSSWTDQYCLLEQLIANKLT